MALQQFVADDLDAATNTATVEFNAAYDLLFDSVNDVITYQQARLDETIVEAQSIASISTIISALAIFLTVAVVIAMVFIIRRSITIPLQRVETAAEKIVNLTIEIQEDTHNVARAVTEGLASVTAGVEIIGQAGEAFTHITESIKTITNQVEDISTTSQ